MTSASATPGAAGAGASPAVVGGGAAGVVALVAAIAILPVVVGPVARAAVPPAAGAAPSPATSEPTDEGVHRALDDEAARRAHAVLRGVDTLPTVLPDDEGVLAAWQIVIDDAAVPLHVRARALRLWAAAPRLHDDRRVDDVLARLQRDVRGSPELAVQAAWARVERARVRGAPGVSVDAGAVVEELLAAASPALREVGVLALWRQCTPAAHARLRTHAATEVDRDVARIATARLARWPARPGCDRAPPARESPQRPAHE